MVDRLKREEKLSSCQIIVVDDASCDSTPQLLERFKNVETVRLFSRSGYGSALKTGFAKATGEWIAFLDLDGTYDPEDLLPMLNKNQQERCELIIGERVSRGEGMPLIRSIGNSIFTNMVKYLYQQPISDSCSGFRMFHRRWVGDILNLPNDGLDYSLAMTIWALNKKIKVVEVPILYHARTGQSKLNILNDGLKFFFTIIGGQFSRSRE